MRLLDDVRLIESSVLAPPTSFAPTFIVYMYGKLLEIRTF